MANDPADFIPLRRLLNTSSSLWTDEQRRLVESMNEAESAWANYKRCKEAGAGNRSVWRASRHAHSLSINVLRAVVVHYQKYGRLPLVHRDLKPIVERRWHPVFVNEFNMHLHNAMKDLSVIVPMNIRGILREKPDAIDLALRKPDKPSRRSPRVFPSTTGTHKGSSRRGGSGHE